MPEETNPQIPQDPQMPQTPQMPNQDQNIPSMNVPATTLSPSAEQNPELDPKKMLNPEADLEQKLAEVPDSTSTEKKLPVKMISIAVIAILIIGAGAYFFFGMGSAEVDDSLIADPPPSIENPFASDEDLEDEEGEEDEEIAEIEVEMETPSNPPSLELQSETPEPAEDPSSEMEEFGAIIDDLKESSEAGFDIIDDTIIEDEPAGEETPEDEDPSGKISR
ncbi:MAG: hypothetical protein PHP74_04625 [Candidatus Gracilibacteria bacterium]|nr:hypothetical protein [Candidatus Gracilibacteria bacterium]